GIAEEHLARLAVPFEQVGVNDPNRPQGTGLGLALTKALVEMHGGRVAVRSAGVGQGSEFIVKLPAPVRAVEVRARESEMSERMTTRRHRVLAVDDNRDSAESLCMLLELWGHEARCAFDGEEALDLVEAFAPDVVLLDIGLPGMSGYDLAVRMRERQTPQRLTLIAVTGYGQEEDKRRASDAGFDHHLIKPVDPDVLERLMSSLVLPAA
ncbi:MAG: response regulator, partial [Burkholderiales bacterium]|nr:response regulator [Burkholderiales bacterium]